MSFKWDTSNYSPETGNKHYRIYVVLDPDDTIKEIHPLNRDGKLAIDQNNEGYGLVTLSAKPATAAISPADIHLNDQSLAVRSNNGALETKSINAKTTTRY